MREPPRILGEDLQACLREQYDLSPVTLEFLPRGKDYSAGLYRVVSERGSDLLKLSSRPLYQPACLVPYYLKEQGITAVVAPIPTKSQALWTRLMDWTVILYPFVEGDTSLTGMTNEQWEEVGSIFQRIHNVRPPPEGFPSMRKESFDPTAYALWIRNFETQHLYARRARNASEQALCATWVARQPTIHTVVSSLEELAGALQSRTHRFAICHADLHAANLIRDHAGHVFVVDWDEVMLAPKERDFIFIREPRAEAFWNGYGRTGIDWTALTYYRWERIAQDLIECAQNVCFRDDLGEESKADIARMVDEMLAEGASHIAAAYAAAARLAG